MDSKITYRPTWVEINLQAIRQNYLNLCQSADRRTTVLPVVKANAYGHGAIPIAETLIAAGATCLAVATLEEALELRNANIDRSILIFGYIPEYGFEVAISNNLIITVMDRSNIEKLQFAAEQKGQVAKIQIKVDTGMGRVGIRAVEQLEEILEQLAGCPNIQLEGIYSHFACADQFDKRYTDEQCRRFQRFLEVLHARGLYPSVHIANSAGIIDQLGMACVVPCEYARAGISLYGYYPSSEVEQLRVQLQPALEFKTRVVHLKQVEAGECIGYGATFQTNRRSSIATLPVGYADGYSRLLSNRGEVLIHGKRASVIGRVCMDQTIIDVTDIPNVNIGDEVVLYGKQQGEYISVEEIAAIMQTISYEVLCAISSRVPRIYV